MGKVFEYDTRVSRRMERSRGGKTYYVEYIAIPSSVKGDQTLYGKRVHVRIEVIDP